MIGIITFIIAIIALGSMFGVFNAKSYFTEPDKYGSRDLKAVAVIKAVCVFIVAVVVSLLEY